MNHADLCKLAVKWLKRPHGAGGPGCAVAVSECRTGWDGETPDAIGFRRTGSPAFDGSTVVEVKTSRADFLADAKKPFRAAGRGVGSWRYYMAPAGLIRIDDLPPGWGLLEVNARRHIKILAGHATSFRSGYGEMERQSSIWRFAQVDHEREQFLLVRALANTGDPQEVLNRLRESARREAALARTVETLQARLQKLNNRLLAREVA